MIRPIQRVTMLTIATVLIACAPHAEFGYPDGIYRGVFIDGDEIQVNVQFRLENGIMTAASFRHLHALEEYHLDTREEPYRSVIQQYEEALDHLVGKNLVAHLDDLYMPQQIVTLEVDGYSAATLRANKIRSAIQDALNRGPYSLPP